MKNFKMISSVSAFALVSVASISAASAASEQSSSSTDTEQMVQNARDTGSRMGIPSKVLDDAEGLIRSGRAGQPGSTTGDEPVAVLKSCTQIPYVAEPVCFDGSGSYIPSGAKISLYYFDCQNGNYSIGSSPTAECVFTMEGSYSPRLQVMDPNGIWSDSVDVKVTLANHPPEALFNVSNSNLSSTYARLSLDGSPSRAYNGARIKSYYWNVCQSVKGQPSKCVTSYDMMTSIDVQRGVQVRITGELKVTDSNLEEGTTQIKMTTTAY